MEINKYRVGEKIVTQPYWGVRKAQGIITKIDDRGPGNSYATILWPEGLYHGNGQEYILPGNTSSVGNPACFKLVKEEVKKVPEQTVAGVRLSKANQQKLVDAAREAAAELGYCDEVNNVLKHIGFEVPNETETFAVYFYYRADLPVDGNEEILDSVYDALNKQHSNNPLTIVVDGEEIVLTPTDSEIDAY